MEKKFFESYALDRLMASTVSICRAEDTSIPETAKATRRLTNTQCTGLVFDGHSESYSEAIKHGCGGLTSQKIEYNHFCH